MNNMQVINKDDNKKYTIYNITYDKTGYPQFLIYKDGEWLRLSAKHFREYTYEDFEKEFIDDYKNGQLTANVL